MTILRPGCVLTTNLPWFSYFTDFTVFAGRLAERTKERGPVLWCLLVRDQSHGATNAVPQQRFLRKRSPGHDHITVR